MKRFSSIVSVIAIVAITLNGCGNSDVISTSDVNNIQETKLIENITNSLKDKEKEKENSSTSGYELFNRKMWKIRKS